MYIKQSTKVTGVNQDRGRVKFMGYERTTCSLFNERPPLL
uniref:Uncharacterized protein n=1 Tax=Lepeophtheirus salmonis TaxID=72036 RepID=A0A0K2UH22_LEPSM